MADVLQTALTVRLGLRVPIVCAPMAGVAGGSLAAAVSQAGGLGMLGVGSATPPDWIGEQAQLTRDADRAYGIGLMAWAQQGNPGQLGAAIAAAPALVSVSFGEYAPYVAPLHDAGILVATQVGTVAQARDAVDAGVDVIVARGSEAGGHGPYGLATLPLLQAVLDAVPDTPVLAAGGIATGRGLAAVLAAGAAGAWVGTAFLGCPEAANHPAARERLCAAGGEETIYTRVFDIGRGIPWPPEYGGRALANDFSARWHGAEDALAGDKAAHRVLQDAISARDYRQAVLYAGQGIGSLTAQRPAAEVVTRMATQAAELLERRTAT